MPEQSLRNKTIDGVGWSAVDTISRYGISFVVGLVLARLLSPKEYGLIGILTIFINVFNAIVDGGFTYAIIRKKNAKNIDYCTVFYTNLFLSIILFLSLFFCARPISMFFKQPELVGLTQLMSLIIIINALAIVQRARLTKNIDFKTQTKITIIASIASGSLGIGMAIGGGGVWSLAVQQLVSQFLTTILLWVFNHWFPKYLFSWTSFKEMWSFGWKLLASSLIGTVWGEVYQVVIGKCYSPMALGLYTRAYQFAALCSSNINTVVQRVSYPVLSVIQDDIPRLRDVYRRIIRITMLPTFILMFGMAACAKQMIFVLIGEQWIACVPYLQIICFNLMLYPLHALNISAIEVVGRSDIVLKLRIIKICLAILPLLLGIFIDIYWMLVGTVFIGYISYLLNAFYSKPFLRYPVKEQIKDIFPSLGIAVVMALPVYILSFIPFNHFILLPFQIILGAGITFVICEKIQLSEYIELKTIALSYLSKIKGNEQN